MTQIQLTLDVDNEVALRSVGRQLSRIARDSLGTGFGFQMTMDGTPVEADKVDDAIDQGRQDMRQARAQQPPT